MSVQTAHRFTLSAFRRLISACVVIQLLACLVAAASPVFAESSAVGTKQGYTPMHMAIIMDCSGSVGNSPETLFNSRSGAACLASSVPLKDNKIAVFGYSDRTTDEAKHIIRDGRLQPIIGLTAVDQYQSRSTVISELNNMRDCVGGTAMVYAIRDAAAYLKQHSEPDAKDVIVVFTDGEETEALDSTLVEDDATLIDRTVKEALEGSDAKVYSIAYDHSGSITGKDGKSGYGYQLLKRFEELSGGRVYDTGKISDLPRCFDEIIGEVCFLPFDDSNWTSFKGDGGEHEKVIHVPPCVAEATIRISCGQLNVIRDGKLQLYNEKGENVSLNSGVNVASENQDVWFTLDDLGATIKLREPNKGDWRIRVSNMISDQDIRETWIMQYNMSVEFAQAEEKQYAVGDTMSVRVVLKSDGAALTDPEIYRTETDQNGLTLHANLICSQGSALPADFGNPKADEVMGKLKALPGAKEIPLKQENPTDAFFTAEIPLEQAGAHLLSAWIDSAYFYCYIDKTVTVGDRIPDAVVVPAITVAHGGTFETEVLKTEDAEKYSDWEVVSASDAVKAQKDGSILRVTGEAVGEGEIRLHYIPKTGAAPEDTVVPVTVTNAAPVISILPNEQTYRKGEEKSLLVDASDIENDPLTFKLAQAGDSAVISAVMDGSTVKLSGIGEGTTEIIVEVSDGEHTVSQAMTVMVKLSTKDIILKWLPWAIGALVLIIVIIILCAIAAKKKRRLFVTLKSAVYVECDSTGAKVSDYTLASGMKLNAKMDCGEIKLGALLRKLAGLSMDSAVQQLAVAGGSHKFEETCGIADSVVCTGGKNEADGVRFSGKNKNMLVDGQAIGEKAESHLRTEPGGVIGLIFRLASGEITQIWLTTKDMSYSISYSQKGEAAAQAWEKAMQQETAKNAASAAAPPESSGSAAETGETAPAGGWQTGEAKPAPKAEEEQSGTPESTGGSGWGSGSGSTGSTGGGSGWGSGSGSTGSTGGGSGWGSGSGSTGSTGGSGWGNGSGSSGGSGWGGGSSGGKW